MEEFDIVARAISCDNYICILLLNRTHLVYTHMYIVHLHYIYISYIRVFVCICFTYIIYRK